MPASVFPQVMAGREGGRELQKGPRGRGSSVTGHAHVYAHLCACTCVPVEVCRCLLRSTRVNVFRLCACTLGLRSASARLCMHGSLCVHILAWATCGM